jgi:hypothetical protein
MPKMPLFLIIPLSSKTKIIIIIIIKNYFFRINANSVFVIGLNHKWLPAV